MLLRCNGIAFALAVWASLSVAMLAVSGAAATPGPSPAASVAPLPAASPSPSAAASAAVPGAGPPTSTAASPTAAFPSATLPPAVSPSPVASAPSSSTPVPTRTPSPAARDTATATTTASADPVASATPTFTRTVRSVDRMAADDALATPAAATVASTPTPTPTPTPSMSPAPTPTPTPTPTPGMPSTPTPTPPPNVTSTSTVTATITPAPTPASSSTATATAPAATTAARPAPAMTLLTTPTPVRRSAPAADLPVVECTWVVAPIPPSGATVPGRFDDDPALDPPPDERCAMLPGSGLLSQADGLRHRIQVRPMAGDRPGPRLVQLFALTSSEAPPPRPGQAGLQWKVRRPDGSLMASVPATAVARGDCAAPGSLETSNAIDGSARTGQLTADAATSVRVRCADGPAQLYQGTVALSYTDGCGEFGFEATLTAPGAEAHRLSATLDVLCFVSVEIDVDGLDWGRIIPGRLARIEGDTTWDRASSRPTIRNTGNSPANISVILTPLVRLDSAGRPGRSTVSEFTACLALSPAGLHCQDRLPASTPAPLGGDGPRAICPGATARLDVSFQVPVMLEPGRYGGTFQLLASTGARTDCRSPAGT